MDDEIPTFMAPAPPEPPAPPGAEPGPDLWPALAYDREQLTEQPGDRTPAGLPAPAPPARPAGPRRSVRTRAALAGGVAGALVAVIASFGVVRLTDHGTTTRVVTQAAAAATPLTSTDTFDVHAVLAKVGTAVVAIDVSQQSRRGVFATGAGSGFVISADGYVLTNNHVVSGASTITVTFADGMTEDATVVGTDPTHDIAVLKIADTHGATPLTLADTSTLQVGDEVLAIGNALDLGDSPTVTLGIVSAKDRTIQTDTETLSGLIQTDAAINPGNSGGPLVDGTGAVVGINAAGVEGANNIGFAIDIATVKSIVTQIEQGAAN